MIVRFDVPSASEVAKRCGLDKDGHAQLFWTQTVYRHLMRYIPMKTGMLHKQTLITSNSTITTFSPAARYLYYGKRMVNAATGKGPMKIPGVGYRWPRGATLRPTNEPLHYTTTFSPLAGPYWDRRLAEAEGAEMAKELEAYINRGPK